MQKLPDNGRPAVSVAGDTIVSEWTSGKIKRTITTRVTGAGQGSQRLAVRRHNKLLNEALQYWPIDP
jgi:hypothetical protein